MFFYPNEINGTAGEASATIIAKVDSTILTDSTVFLNTITTKFDQSYYGSYIKSEIYTKNVGVIRIEYFDGRIFELKKYYINN